MAIATLERLWIANAHSHATKLTRNGVACYSVMRVCPLSGGRRRRPRAYAWRILKRTHTLPRRRSKSSSGAKTHAPSLEKSEQ